MGERPVQMGAGEMGGGGTGAGAFPGQADAYTPGFDAVGKGKTRRMSRGTNNRGTPMTVNETVVKLQRQVASLQQERKAERVRYARSEAERRIDALVSEGYQFGTTPDTHARNVANEKNHWANIIATAPTVDEGIADVEAEETVIRERYSKKRSDPSRVNVGDISRYGRNPLAGAGRPGTPAGAGGDGEDFDPQTDDEITEYADLVGVRKMSRKEAGQLMLRRRTQR